jgi:hypothetical protein
VQTMAFSMISRAVGGVHMLLDSIFARCPYTLWRLIEPSISIDDAVRAVVEVPLCMQDSFTKAFRRRFESADQLQSVESRAVLAAMATLLRLDTSRIECRHAFLRRVLHLKGQTWAHEISAASADWLLARQRILDDKGEKENDDDDDPDDEVHHAGGGGGAARAFLSKYLEEHRQDFANKKALFTAAHAAYKEAKQAASDEYIECLRRGRQATLAHQVGGVSFAHRPARPGPEVAAGGGPNALVPFAVQGDDGEEEGSADEVDEAWWAVAAADPARTDIEEKMKNINVDGRARTRAKVQAREDRDQNIKQWVLLRGREVAGRPWMLRCGPQRAALCPKAHPLALAWMCIVGSALFSAWPSMSWRMLTRN